ncbi:MAG: NDP-sugar synthase [Chloroflexi bacterium]|nr:NDP-sugar synthase [Chloroflexota bacterium]MBI3931172.1 NDP-sugar synthase [Chloroflexota bacterium]
MRAVILVGGKATRLLPLTVNIPKAIIPVLNTPFLEHVIRHLSRHRIKDIILAQGHLAQPIQGYLGDGRQFGVKLSYVVEDTPRGTAGAVKNAASYLDDTFLVLNGDVFTDLDITAMIDFHRERKAKATIALAVVDDPTAYGLIKTDAEGRVSRFLEKPGREEVLQRRTNMINAGTYILEPDVLALIPPQQEVSIERETFQQLLARGEAMYAYSSPAYWLDMGTPEKYLQLHRDLLSGKCRHYGLNPGKGVLLGEHTDIHPTTQIKGPVIIGNNCSIGRRVQLIGPVVIGDGSTILEDSVIEDSVIWRNARLGPRVTLKNSIVADNCCLNESSSCLGSVLGDNVAVLSGCKLEPGSKIWPGEAVG